MFGKMPVAFSSLGSSVLLGASVRVKRSVGSGIKVSVTCVK